MPQLGETVTEGTITKWLKQVGDQVAIDEPLFEVSTDKVDSEVPSPVAGVLTEIVVPEGDTVDVGVRLAVIGDGVGPARRRGRVDHRTGPDPRRPRHRHRRPRHRRPAPPPAPPPPAPTPPAAPPTPPAPTPPAGHRHRLGPARRSRPGRLPRAV